jgi:hypothetical protein
MGVNWSELELNWSARQLIHQSSALAKRAGSPNASHALHQRHLAHLAWPATA